MSVDPTFRAAISAPRTSASTAKRVCSHGRIASATAVARRKRSDAARPASIAATPTITRIAPGPSGNATNDWKKNGTDRATAAQPNQLDTASSVIRHTALHVSAVAQPLASASSTTTPGYPNSANAGATSAGSPGA